MLTLQKCYFNSIDICNYDSLKSFVRSKELPVANLVKCCLCYHQYMNRLNYLYLVGDTAHQKMAIEMNGTNF